MMAECVWVNIVLNICYSCWHSCLQRGADHDGKCPVCCNKPETQKLASAQRSQAESRDRHDEFHNLLHKSPDPFGLVAEYFDRGLFNQLVVVDEIESMDVSNMNMICVIMISMSISLRFADQPEPSRRCTTTKVSGRGRTETDERADRLRHGRRGQNAPA